MIVRELMFRIVSVEGKFLEFLINVSQHEEADFSILHIPLGNVFCDEINFAGSILLDPVMTKMHYSCSVPS